MFIFLTQKEITHVAKLREITGKTRVLYPELAEITGETRFAKWVTNGIKTTPYTTIVPVTYCGVPGSTCLSKTGLIIIGSCFSIFGSLSVCIHYLRTEGLTARVLSWPEAKRILQRPRDNMVTWRDRCHCN